MKRRGFLKAVGGVGAALAAGGTAVAATPAVNPDDGTAYGYRIKWREFQALPTQNIVCGMWHAKHESQDLEWVATTLGQCYPSRAWEVVDLSQASGWPVLTGFSTDAERAEVKQRARDALLTTLAIQVPLLTKAERRAIRDEQWRNAPREKRMSDPGQWK